MPAPCGGPAPGESCPVAAAEARHTDPLGRSVCLLCLSRARENHVRRTRHVDPLKVTATDAPWRKCACGKRARTRYGPTGELCCNLCYNQLDRAARKHRGRVYASHAPGRKRPPAAAERERYHVRKWAEDAAAAVVRAVTA